jgi:hypothetical protein
VNSGDPSIRARALKSLGLSTPTHGASRIACITPRIEKPTTFHRGRSPTDITVETPELVYPGLSLEEVLELDFLEPRDVLEGTIGFGEPGVIVGLPESFKSYLALLLALGIASSRETVIGREIQTPGPVGFWGEDNTTAAEVARIRQLVQAHGYPREAEVRFHLNEGLRLPRDLALLREEIVREGQVAVFLDSFVNVLEPGLSPRDETAADLIDAIKQVANETGCAVAALDHSPWPGENTGQQVRSYGSVFKWAGIRWWISCKRKGKSNEVWIASGGNNVRGLDRELWEWDHGQLEFRRAEHAKAQAAEERQREKDAEVLEFIRERPYATKRQVRSGVPGDNNRIDDAIDALSTAGLIVLDQHPESSTRGWKAVDPP